MGDASARGDSDKCLACHFTGGDAVHALAAHGVAVSWPDRSPDEPPPAPSAPTLALALAGLSGTSHLAGDLACATCHHEHRGRHHDLTFMSDTHCQVCHRSQFGGFGPAHPAFRTGGTSFDHTTHRRDHFGSRPFECRDCHQLDAAGRMLRPFDQSCRGCHSGGIPDHHGRQLEKTTVLLWLPELTVTRDDVPWPDGGYDPEEELPPLLELLLAGDDEAVEVLRALDEAGGLPFDLEEDDQTRLAVVIRRLIDDLLDEDDDRRRRRLAQALGGERSDPTIADLARQLAMASGAVRALDAYWREGDEDEAEPAPGGWQASGEDYTVQYGFAGHADPVAKAWLDALVAHTTAGGPGEGAGFRAALRAEVLGDAAGLQACLKCHARNERDRVSWYPAGDERRAAHDARFDHRPHLVLLGGDESCHHCHQMAGGAAGRITAITFPEGTVLSHTTAQCTACHQPGGTDHQCLVCHSYHFHRP